jgi:tetratricopeptide (TPR) repeat protein
MTLLAQLNTLEASGLILPAQTVPELEYLFRHALVQDAAYASLLKQDRRRLHLAAGEVLESIFNNRLDEVAPVLGQHFAEAGDAVRAIKYFTRAGDIAAGRYANAEAVMHYSRAITISSDHQRNDLLPGLYGARGLVYELMGDFERARLDHETATVIARQRTDQLEEIKALLNLGMLWAGRDYTRTGEYYRRAYELANAAGDPCNLAHSMNSVGNWYINVDRPTEALEHHRKALGIFEQLQDQHGLAETLDFLGMASMLGGDTDSSVRYYERAINLFRQLDDRRGIMSGLTTLTFQCANYLTNVLVTLRPIGDAATHVEEALAMARESGIRSAEAYSLIVLAECRGSQGRYGRALALGQEGLQIALEIGHRQWSAFAYAILGCIHHDLFDLPQARDLLEQALALASAVNSLHWIRTASGLLASVCVAQGDFIRAQAVLDQALPPGTPARSPGQRLSWAARAEMALAQGNPDQALRAVDQLITHSPASASGKTILRVAFLRGQALVALGSLDEALTELAAAETLAAEQGVEAMHWRILVALGKLYRQRGDGANADHTLTCARSVALAIADAIPGEAARRRFTGEVERLWAA